MFKMNPDNADLEAGMSITTGQTFSLIMEYVEYGSLMQRLDAGLAKSKESPPILRCGFSNWKMPTKMFIGIDDWELKLHLALGIARGIRAMHKGGVWHRDLKSSNVLIKLYHPTQVCPPTSSSISTSTTCSPVHLPPLTLPITGRVGGS